VSDLRFDWYEPKNEGNQRKHGVSFEEAKTVFSDDMPSSWETWIIPTARIGSCSSA
jgi:uncharacterized DUF497 family protein